MWTEERMGLQGERAPACCALSQHVYSKAGARLVTFPWELAQEMQGLECAVLRGVFGKRD